MSSTVVDQAMAQVYEYGSSGSTVQRIQKFLGLNPTGTYDFATQAAVASFQRQRGLSVDGRVGPETLSAMGLVEVVERPVSYSGGYSERPVAFQADPRLGTVVTQSGIGLNIRQGPGLGYPVIDGAEDGVLVELGTRRVLADSYRWADLRSGGWVATEYVAGGGTTTNVSYHNGDCSTFCGTGGTYSNVDYLPPGGVANNNGIDNTYYYPGYRSGPYVVVVPGSSSALLGQVRRIAYDAFPDKARQGAFINAGAFNDIDRADALSSQLRSIGLDARVAYRPR